MSTWTSGNAIKDGEDRRGWIVGYFIDEDPTKLRTSNDVEIKWATHPAGDTRDAWMTDEYRTTIVILVRGRFRIDLPGNSVLLETEGDYATWGPGTNHSWRADEESVVVTIRWPSVDTDSTVGQDF